MRLGNAIGRYYEIQKASKDKILKSPLVVEAWRGQVLWVDQAWRVFLVILVVTAQVFKKKKKKVLPPTHHSLPFIFYLSLYLFGQPSLSSHLFSFFFSQTHKHSLTLSHQCHFMLSSPPSFFRQCHRKILRNL